MSTSHTIAGILGVSARPDYESASPDRWVVRFDTEHAGMCHQLYANGRLVAWTDRPDERRFVVEARPTAQVLDVAACTPDERMIDAAGQLGLADHGGQWNCRLRVVRLPSARPADCVQVLDTDGAVLYDAPALPAWAPLWGLGHEAFGTAGFGFDSAEAPGLGHGTFGAGPLGIDAPVVPIDIPLPAEGAHRLTAQFCRAGRAAAALEPVTVLSTPPAPLPSRLAFAAFDPDTNRFSFTIEKG
jgi:hypothetical protein